MELKPEDSLLVYRFKMMRITPLFTVSGKNIATTSSQSTFIIFKCSPSSNFVNHLYSIKQRNMIVFMKVA